MKKIYSSLFLFLCLLASHNALATIHQVTVNSGSFSPATINVTTGDTVEWVLGSGSHTTTSTSVPPGANSWDSPINFNVQSFQYPVTVSGTYNYQCTPHGFTGSIVATGSSGISGPGAAEHFNINYVRQSVYNVSYNLRHSSEVRLSVYDLTGKLVRNLGASYKQAGEYVDTYYFDDLQNGIYLLELFAGNKRFTKRIIID